MVFKINYLSASLFFLILFLILTFFYWGYVITEEETFFKLIAKIKSLETKISEEFVPLEEVAIKEIKNNPIMNIFLIKFILLFIT